MARSRVPRTLNLNGGEGIFRENSVSIHHTLITIRLLLLSILLCFLFLFTRLQQLDDISTGWGLDSQPLPDSPATQIPFLGINVALEQYDLFERQQVLVRLKDNGFGWVRQRLDWSMMEPTQDHFVWQESDDILQAIHDSGLIPVIVLDGSPAWAREAKDQPPTENRTAPPAHPATFAHFVMTFAQRYGQQVRYYQIWDEPNIEPRWGNRHIEPVAYGQLLIAASRAIRQADTDAVILTAALAPTADLGHLGIDEVTFLQRLYGTGAAPYFDVVALQPMGFNYLPQDARQQRETLNFQRIAWIRRAMLAAGDSATPIWAVRYGWNRQVDSPWSTVSPQRQAEFSSTALTIAQENWPWLEATAWAIDQPNAPPDDPLWGFALIDPMGKRQPILDALSAWDSKEPNFSLKSLQTQFLTLHHLGYLFILLTLWRMFAIVKNLPWQHYINHYNAAHPLWHIIGWITLIVIYYFATWPPLIMFCYLVATFWITAQPLAGLALAALLLPFHIYAKELQLLNNIWPIPPTQALLLCTLPVLSSRHLVIPSSGHLVILPSTWLLINLLPMFHIWHWPGYLRGMNDFVLMPLLFYVAIRTLIRTERARWILLIALAAGGVLVASIGWWQWLQGTGIVADGINRLIGTHYSPNHTALYLLRTLFLLIGLHLSIPRFSFFTLHSSLFTIPSSLSIVLVFSALWLTASRGALLLGLPAGIIILMWPIRHNIIGIKSLSKYIVPIGSLSLLLIIAIITFYPNLFDQYSTRLANSETLFRRLDIWQTTLRLWWDHPLGIGPGGFYWHYPAYIPLQFLNDLEPNLRHPHNVWLAFGATAGWLGFIWLLGWLVWLKYATVKAWNASPSPWLKLGIIASLVASLAHAQVDAFMMLPDLAGWFWVAMGLWEEPEV